MLFRIYNTLSRKVEEFLPVEPGKAGIYCCGPTVYNFQHIGNLRTYVFEDVLVRALRYAGYTVRHVMNITDVGHLVSDADEGEDKMLVAVRREKKSSAEIAEYYTQAFFEHCRWLNIQKPDVVCKATEHVADMIELVRRLFDNGIAYQSGGNVYFDVSRFQPYGELARLDLESLKAGARIDVDDNKRHPLDFALWFTNSKFENQELQWDSPWGRGYPGWHIECSAMSMKYLGEEFDIHCGGIDHIPVHHTNEIAQSQGATGKPLARYWVHGGFLVVDKEKMSKSKGGFLTLDLLKEQGFDPLAYRLFCLSGSYRNELAWSFEALENAQKTLVRLKNSVLALRESAAPQAALAAREALSPGAAEFRSRFIEAVSDDLAMPRALAVVHAVLGNTELTPQEKYALLLDFDSVLGLGVSEWKSEETEIPDAVLELVEKRNAARQAREWKTADDIRQQILDLGFVLEDTRDGPKLKAKSEF